MLLITFLCFWRSRVSQYRSLFPTPPSQHYHHHYHYHYYYHLQIIKGTVAPLIINCHGLNQGGEEGGDDLPGAAAISVETGWRTALKEN